MKSYAFKRGEASKTTNLSFKAETPFPLANSCLARLALAIESIFTCSIFQIVQLSNFALVNLENEEQKRHKNWLDLTK